jgi:uncharacterized protein
LLSKESGRSLVTSDMDLYLRAKKQGIPSALILCRNDQDRLVELFSELGRATISASNPPRCSLCNGELRDSGRQSSRGKKIWLCPACGKEYWKGSHWRKLELLFRNVDKLLISNQKLQDG